MSLVDLHVHVSPEIGRLDLLKLDETLTNLRFIWVRQHSTENVCTSVKNIPLAFLFTQYIAAAHNPRSSHFPNFKCFLIFTLNLQRRAGDALMDKPTTVLDRNTTLSHLHFDWMKDSGNFQDVYHIKGKVFFRRTF